jgi:hypothetical protein
MTLAGHPPPPTQLPITCAPEPFLENLAPHYPLDPHRGVLSDEPTSEHVPPVIVPADDIVPGDTATTLDDAPDISPPVEMPTPDAADSHLYDVVPSEHADGEQEEEPDTEPNERPIAAAEEIAAISNNTRYNLRRSTTDQHVLSTMTIKESVLIYGDSAVQEAGRVELQNCLDKNVWECIPRDVKVIRPIPSKLFLTPKMTPEGKDEK